MAQSEGNTSQAAQAPPPLQTEGYLAEFPLPRWQAAAGWAAVAALYLAGVTNQWWATSDSALYLGLGRSLFSGHGYWFNGQVDNTVAPGTPALFGLLWWAFGEGFWTHNLLMALCGVGSCLMAYLTLRRITTVRLAFAAVLLTALSDNYYAHCHLILSDAPFALLFWSLAYASLRAMRGGVAWCLLAAGLAVVAILIRVPGVIAIAALGAGLLLDTSCGAAWRRRLAVAAGLVGTAIVVTGGLYLVARQAATHAPGYEKYAQFTVGHRLAELGKGLAQVPEITAEVLTGQGGTASAVLGVFLLGLILLAMVHLWRGGRRLVPTTVVLLIVGLAFGARAEAVRTRYLMPVHPMIVFALLYGLCRAMELLGRRRPGVRPVHLLYAATIATAVLLACNLPKVARGAFYYSYLAHTGRFYQVTRSGQVADLQAAADLLRRDLPEGARIASRQDRSAILYHLTGRTIQPLPKSECRTARDAEDAFEFLREGSFDAIVTSTAGQAEAYNDRLANLLAGSAGLKAIPCGKSVTVYRRTATSRPAGAEH